MFARLDLELIQQNGSAILGSHFRPDIHNKDSRIEVEMCGKAVTRPQAVSSSPPPSMCMLMIAYSGEREISQEQAIRSAEQLDVLRSPKKN
jgi:hypothetical protein